MALLVGGALRDLMRGVQPRDYDVVTNASIDQIRHIFRNSKTIGKRFPIVHTYFAGDVIEISSLKPADEDDGDNHGDAAELGDDHEDTDEREASFTCDEQRQLLLVDARQRDFTINAIYYDIRNFEVIDPLGAIEHLEQRRLVPIGDPRVRFQEDPVRMLRALKLSERHGFTIAGDLEKVIQEMAATVNEIGPGRKYEELTRILLSEDAEDVLVRLRQMGLLRRLWPSGDQLLEKLGFGAVAECIHAVPIHYSRGSYAKETHTKLWMSLFLLTDHQPTTSSKEERPALDAFLGSLGMPFRTPIIEALACLGALRQQKGAYGGAPISSEVAGMLEFWVGSFEPQLSQQLEHFFKHHAGGGRRRRKGGGERRPGQNTGHKGKPRRRRRRRRGN
nr:hypothetical protein [Acanthopleuribacter pedis]